MNKRKSKPTRYKRVLDSHFGEVNSADLSNATAATIDEIRRAFALQKCLSREQLISLYATILKELVNG